MTPSEYIASIKADFPPTALEESSLPNWLKTQLVESGRDIAEFVKSVNQSDWAQMLFDHVKPRLSHPLKSLFESGFIAIGATGNALPDVHLKRLDTGYAIVFHEGMRDFIYRVSRVIATRFFPTGTVIGPSAGDGLKEAARIIAEVFWWRQETGHAFGPQYPVDEFQIRIANLLAMESEAFLIFHEIGHIILDLRDGSSTPLLDLQEEISPSHRDEFTADFLGLQIMLELHNVNAENDAFDAAIKYAAIEFALQIYHGLEESGIELEDSHPAARLRIESIRREMQKRCKDDSVWNSLFGLALAIDSMFEQIVCIIKEPNEHAEFFERAANDVVSDLDQALDRCTGGVVPNYLGFYSIAHEIFGRGYSHIMLQRIAQVAANFFTSASSPDDPELKPNNASWVRLQKYKLLFSYIEQYLNEPARTIFLKALESGQDGS